MNDIPKRCNCPQCQPIGVDCPAAAEIAAYRDRGVTEELLRRNDGCIKVGKGCAIVRADEWDEMESKHQTALSCLADERRKKEVAIAERDALKAAKGGAK